MVTKKHEIFRSDILTAELLLALVAHQNKKENKKTSKTDVYRRAIYRMAKEELDPEIFTNIITKTTEKEL